MLFLVFLFPFYALATPDLQDRIQISEVAGSKEVKVIRVALGKEQILHTGDTLYVGDELIVSKGQIVGLETYDGSKWKVAPGTRLKLESRVVNKEKVFYWLFQLVKGAMWGQVPKSGEQKNDFKLKIHSSTAALGIRGTEYLMAGDEKGSSLDVLEGKVWWGNDLSFAKGSYKLVVAGQHAEIDASGKITIQKSKPQKSSLPEDYGLVLGKEEKEKIYGSAEHCFSLGKGWKSADGSLAGECVDRN